MISFGGFLHSSACAVALFAVPIFVVRRKPLNRNGYHGVLIVLFVLVNVDAHTDNNFAVFTGWSPERYRPLFLSPIPFGLGGALSFFTTETKGQSLPA